MGYYRATWILSLDTEANRRSYNNIKHYKMEDHYQKMFFVVDEVIKYALEQHPTVRASSLGRKNDNEYTVTHGGKDYVIYEYAE